MKAAVLQDVEKLFIEDVSRPVCPSDSILIKISACAVCGTDVKTYHHGHRMIKFPRIIGHEMAGIVEEVGKDARMPSPLKSGDRVAIAPAVPCGECEYCHSSMQNMCANLTAIGYHYDGGFAEYIAAPSVALRNGCVNAFSEKISFEEAAIAEPLACCINGQELSGVKMGQVVVIIGAGPVGCFHVQLARAHGAKKVILVDISSERLAKSKWAVPDICIDSSRENLENRISEETNGKKADVVIVACSSGKAQEEGLKLVARRGNINFFGGLPKDNPFIRFDSNILHYNEIYAVGTHGSSPRHNRMALDLIATGRVNAKELITHYLPLEKILEGIEITGQPDTLKVIIKP